MSVYDPDAVKEMIKEAVEYDIKRFDSYITYIKERLSKLKEFSNSNDKELTKLMLSNRILRVMDGINALFHDIISPRYFEYHIFSVIEGQPSYKRFGKQLNEWFEKKLNERLNELNSLRKQIYEYLSTLSDIKVNLEIRRDEIADEISYEISDKIDIDELDELLIKQVLEHE